MFSRTPGEFMVQLKGEAENLLLKSFAGTDEIFGLGLLTMVSAAIALGEQLRGKSIILSLGKNAASVAMIKASARAQIILAITERSRQHVAQLAAS